MAVGGICPPPPPLPLQLIRVNSCPALILCMLGSFYLHFPYVVPLIHVSVQGRLTNRFCYRQYFFNAGGGVYTQERFSNVSNNQFLKWGNCQETLLVRKNFIGNINLGQTSYLNFDKFGISKQRS